MSPHLEVHSSPPARVKVRAALPVPYRFVPVVSVTGGGGGASTLAELTDVAAIDAPTDTPGVEDYELVLSNDCPALSGFGELLPFTDYGLDGIGDTADLSTAAGIVAGSFEIDWPVDARQQGASVSSIVSQLTVAVTGSDAGFYIGAVSDNNGTPVIADGEFTVTASDNPDMTVTIVPSFGFQAVGLASNSGTQSVTLTLEYTPLGPVRQHVRDVHLEIGWVSPGVDAQLTWDSGSAPGRTGDVYDQGTDLIESAMSVDIGRMVDESIERVPPPLIPISGEDVFSQPVDETTSVLYLGAGTGLDQVGLALENIGGRQHLIPVKLWTPEVFTYNAPVDFSMAGGMSNTLPNFYGSPHADVMFLTYITVTSDEHYLGEAIPFTVAFTNEAVTQSDTRPVPLAGEWALRSQLVVTMDLFRGSGEQIQSSIQIDWPAYTANPLTNAVLDIKVYMLAEKYW